MDPLFVYLNRIPGAITVKGYVDDTTMIGHAQDPDWLATVADCYQDLATAIHWEEEAPLILNTLAMTPKRIQPGKS